MLVALFSLAVIFLLLAQHSFFTYPLGLIVFHRNLDLLQPNYPEDFQYPSLSVLCCCHNEELSINEKVQNGISAAAKYPGVVEFLYYLDACTDGTAKILEAYGDRIHIIHSEGHTGKSVGMRELAARANGEIFVFTDANTFLDEQAFVEAARGLASPEVGGVTGVLHCTNEDASEIARVNSLYWQLEELIKRVESRTGSTMGADGAFFAIRRELYVPTPPDIIDDMHTSMQVVLSGRRLVSIPSIKTFEKTATKSADEFRRKVRIACRAFNCYRVIAPRLHACGGGASYRFYSHKVLRWLSLPLALTGGVSLLMGLILAGMVWLSAALLLSIIVIAFAGCLGVRPFTAAYEMIKSLSAVTVGVLQSLRGHRYQKWSVASSGR